MTQTYQFTGQNYADNKRTQINLVLSFYLLLFIIVDIKTKGTLSFEHFY